ncbi:MAG: hypothetical protein QMD50_02715 [Patescibacteria group bacterium]|nr:hypothetical protein [Patescibacteria group bacterium]
MKSLNFIHYHTNEVDTLYGQLVEAIRLGGRNINGLQLNIAWPAPQILEKFRLNFPKIKIVFQVGNHAFQMAQNSPEKVARIIHEEYDGLADYVLLDMSGGKGKEINIPLIHEYLDAIEAKNPK